MTIDITRSTLQTMASLLGLAFAEVVPVVGNTNSNGTWNGMEQVLTILRGSTRYSDTVTTNGFLQFGADDSVDLGIFGCALDYKPYTFTSFPVYNPTYDGNWCPTYDGPPCPEGWGILGYHNWMNYSGGGNDYSDPTPSRRLNYIYPIAYNFTANTYQEVPYFERGRYISLYNNTGSSINPSGNIFTFTLTGEQISGVQTFTRNSVSHVRLPHDVLFFTNQKLIQSYNESWGVINQPGVNDTFTPVSAYIGLDSDGVSYLVSVEMPPSITAWPANTYWHLVMFWGSKDPYIDAIKPTIPSGTGVSVDVGKIIWLPKNFFETAICDQVSWIPTANATPSIVAKNRTRYQFYDGQYSDPPDPEIYPLGSVFPSPSTSGFPSRFANYITVPQGCVVPAIVVTYPNATSTQTEPQLLLGPILYPQQFPKNWSECEYFPEVPYEGIVIMRAIVGCASQNTFGLNEDTNAYYEPLNGSLPITCVTTILWLEQSILSYSVPTLGNALLSNKVLSNLMNSLQNIRNLNLSSIYANLLIQTLVPATQVPTVLAPTAQSLINTSNAQIALHNLLKYPFTTGLEQTSIDALPEISLDANSRALISYVTGEDPSIDLLWLNSNNFYLTGNKLLNPNTLEIYMLEQNYDLQVSNTTSPGDGLQWDYTLRLVLEDENQNTLQKDLYIMASEYYLTSEEWQARILDSQSLSGYYNPDTIATVNNGIAQYRLYGTAGLIPNMYGGNSTIIQTREVAPPDTTQTTYQQFVAAQGNVSASVLNEAILDYEENNNFYTVDTSSYPNEFVGVNYAAISVTTYTINSEPYWTSNIGSYYNSNIAPAVTQFPPDQSGNTGNDLPLVGEQAIQISVSGISNLYEIGLNLKAVLNPTNNSGALSNAANGYYYVTLNANNSGRPGVILANFTTISFSSISNAYQEINIHLSSMYTLLPGVMYWITLTPSVYPTGGAVVMDTSAIDNYTGLLLYKYATYYPGSSGSSNSSKSSVSSRSSGSSSSSVSSRSSGSSGSGTNSDGWFTNVGAAWLKLYTLAAPISDSFTIAQAGLYPGDLEGSNIPYFTFGAFNRSADGTDTYLPPSNNLRAQTGYQVDSTWAYTCAQLDIPTLLWAYPRAVNVNGIWSYVHFGHNVNFVVNSNVGGVTKSFQGVFQSNGSSSPPPLPIQIGDNTFVASGISYLGVGKTAIELQTLTNGAPPGDTFVLRST